MMMRLGETWGNCGTTGPVWKTWPFSTRYWCVGKIFPGVGAEFDANPGVAILIFCFTFGSRSGNCQDPSSGAAIPKIQVKILPNLGHLSQSMVGFLWSGTSDSFENLGYSKIKVKRWRIMKKSKTLIFTISSKIGSFQYSRPIWKVCTFLVRSYEQPKKIPGVRVKFDANPGAEILRF